VIGGPADFIDRIVDQVHLHVQNWIQVLQCEDILALPQRFIVGMYYICVLDADLLLIMTVIHSKDVVRGHKRRNKSVYKKRGVKIKTTKKRKKKGQEADNTCSNYRDPS
jgi:hypothetical protein